MADISILFMLQPGWHYPLSNAIHNRSTQLSPPQNPHQQRRPHSLSFGRCSPPPSFTLCHLFQPPFFPSGSINFSISSAFLKSIYLEMTSQAELMSA
ncbi:hypothetical protein PRUPE_6G173400 [Prunus persica]|uniref:Uncharacterized protein n=1 Tax=Prunus persica TaxID=3760 RepID=A0A251NRR2_PRUPE|nr:hypothetical protein PRUPE_6G173400 [Prunus persica]